MANASLARFVELVCQSQLLENGQREDLQRLQDEFSDARSLAQELIRRDWLTAYQVNQLIQGKAADLVLGHYVLLERLGEGGMGQVFKARHRNLQRIVALKVIRKEYLNNPRVIQRFQREMRMTGQLSHPNIVHAYDADEASGTYFIAMEMIDGVDLAHLVKMDGPLSVAQACDYIRQAALGLQHAHERGLVHRDIKPANLLVTREKSKATATMLPQPKRAHQAAARSEQPPSWSGSPWGVVKILDMGLARLADTEDGATHLTQIGTLMGTPDYIAPEQARNCSATDIRSDLYSVGGTLYFLLAGVPPFPSGSMMDKLVQHYSAEPEPVEVVRRARLLALATEGRRANKSQMAVPGEVQAVIKKLMAKNPDDRIQTPGALADALAGILESLEKKPLVQNDVASRAAKTPPPTPPRGDHPAKQAESSGNCSVASAPIINLAKARRRPRTARKRRAWVIGGVVAVLAIGIALSAMDRARHEVGANPPENRDAPLPPKKAPCYFDELDRGKIDRKQTFEWQPKELVAILGVWKPFTELTKTASVAVTSDGRWVITGNDDGSIRAWDMTSETEHKVFGHSKAIARVATAPNGKSFVTAGMDGSTKLWDTATRTVTFTLERLHKPILSVAFNYDGGTVASGSLDGTIRLFDAQTGAERKSFDGKVGRVLALAFATDDKTLFWTGENGAVRWADATDTVLEKQNALYGAGVPAKTLAFTSDGKTLLCGGIGEGQLRLCAWDGKRLKETLSLAEHAGFVNEAAFAPDGKSFATVSDDKTVKFWYTLTGNPEKSLELRWPIFGVAFTPDGRHIVTANANHTFYVLRMSGK